VTVTGVPDVTVTVAIESGSVAESIVRYASEKEVDLIVMAPARRRKLLSCLSKSLFDRVAPRVACPLIPVNREHARAMRNSRSSESLALRIAMGQKW
jgi:nucleotide-binding universal stress UspA family protein